VRSVLTDLTIRSYRDADEDEVLALLSLSLGSAPAARRGFFRWKHHANPFGRTFMLVAEADGAIVGLRAFMRWEFVSSGQSFRAVRAVDTATHPAHQRAGIFSRLTGQALEGLNGEADFVFNTPNEKSLSGYLKLGWQVVGRLPVRIRIRRPLHFAAGIRHLGAQGETHQIGPPVDAESAAEALRDAESLSHLLAECAEDGGMFATPRSVDYLRWRYGSAPLLDYRAVRVESGGRLRGMSIFRVRPRGTLWESTIAEVIVPAGDSRTVRRLLRRVARTAAVDHLSVLFPPRSVQARALRRTAFVRAPGGLILTVNPLRTGISPDPTEMRSWALALGDLEVF
jgi:GNAT superfamily N-acetyltransferase